MVVLRAIVRNRARKPLPETLRGLIQKMGGQNELERKSAGKIKQSTLSKLLANPQANPRLNTLINLADVLGVTVCQLIGDPLSDDDYRQSRFYVLYTKLLDAPADEKVFVEKSIEDLIFRLERETVKRRTMTTR